MSEPHRGIEPVLPSNRVFAAPGGSASVHLDALRGLAAISVMISHWRDLFYVDYPAFAVHNVFTKAAYLVTGLGHQWVIVFFVLSGYLVGGSVLRAVRSGRWSWRDYLFLRSTRLYVVLLPALLLGGTADWIGTHLPGSDAIYSGQAGLHEFTADARPNMTLTVMGANAVFLQTLSLPGMQGRSIPTFGSNGPLWSLCNEFWYYIAFPLLVLVWVRRGKGKASGPERPGSARQGSARPGSEHSGLNQAVWMRILCVLALIAWAVFVGPSVAWLGVTWLTGAAILLLPRWSVRSDRVHSLAVVVAMGLFFGGLVLHKSRPFLPASIVLGVAVALLIWVTLRQGSMRLPSVYVRVATWTSHRSYTLYLIHLPMLILCKVALHLPRASVFNGRFFLITLGLLAATVVYTQGVYWIFERNTDHVRRWLRPYVDGHRRRAVTD